MELHLNFEKDVTSKHDQSKKALSPKKRIFWICRTQNFSTRVKHPQIVSICPYFCSKTQMNLIPTVKT